MSTLRAAARNATTPLDATAGSDESAFIADRRLDPPNHDATVLRSTGISDGPYVYWAFWGGQARGCVNSVRLLETSPIAADRETMQAANMRRRWWAGLAVVALLACVGAIGAHYSTRPYRPGTTITQTLSVTDTDCKIEIVGGDATRPSYL